MKMKHDATLDKVQALKEFFDVLRLHAGPLPKRFAELDCRDIGESAAEAAETAS
jgi:hypothetical protein